VPVVVRPPAVDELPLLREIERAAGAQFRQVGLAAVADDEPFSLEQLAQYADAGRAWVAVDETDRPIGYLLAEVVDGCAHVEQLSVRPDQQSRGAGRALLEHVRVWATRSGMPAVTLTTFSEVPWNAALYRHIGFRVLAEDEIGPELRGVCDAEAARGLDLASRVCMVWTGPE
jgi:GNAT superfamily N-acetyltransferase